MGLLSNWGSKLQQTNDALAHAHKSWRDKKLGAREQQATDWERSLSEREARVAEQLAEMRSIESKRWWRKVVLIGTAIVAGVMGFVLGFEAANSTPNGPVTPTKHDAQPAAASATEKRASTKAISQAATPARPQRTQHADPDAAARRGAYGTGKDFNVGYYCLDVEATGEATFDECLGAAAIALSSR